MSSTFTVLGGDGNQYGPITPDQFQTWLREGRVNGATQVCRTNESSWAPASTFSELGAPAVAATAPMAVPVGAGSYQAPATPIASDIDPNVDRAIKSGASWFYWIAALSLVNTVIAFTGSDWRFIFGLGITQFFDAAAASLGGTGGVVAAALSFLTAGIFILFGVFGSKRHTWAFIVGMVLFGLDTILCGIARDWISLAFHIFALFCIYSGFRALRSIA